MIWKNGTSLTLELMGGKNRNRTGTKLVEGSFYLGDKARFIGQKKRDEKSWSQ